MAKGLLLESSFLSFLSFMAISKLPTPFLSKRILITPFFEEKDSIFIGSPSLLKSSLIDIFRFTSPAYTKVSPSNGALLMILNLSMVTFARGKLLNKLKSTSLNATFASTFSLIDFKTSCLILSLNKNGAAANAMIITNRNIPTAFKIFFNIINLFI
ncbi:hypothetical protein D3C72_1404760 [compost metagenome]